MDDEDEDEEEEKVVNVVDDLDGSSNKRRRRKRKLTARMNHNLSLTVVHPSSNATRNNNIIIGNNGTHCIQKTETDNVPQQISMPTSLTRLQPLSLQQKTTTKLAKASFSLVKSQNRFVFHHQLRTTSGQHFFCFVIAVFRFAIQDSFFLLPHLLS